MNTLLSIAKERTFLKDERIFHIGQKADYVFQVIKGKVDLYHHTESGKRIQLFRAHDGDYFAEASLNASEYHCTAVCITPTSVYCFDAANVKEQLRNDIEFAMTWISHLSTELRRQRANVERLNLKSPADRIIHYISTEGGSNGEVILTGTLSELAEVINVSRETLYRTLAAMEKEGLLMRGEYSLSLR